MFLVDDLLKSVLDYFSKRVQANQAGLDASIDDSRKAMRKLASSLSEVAGILEAGLHRLRRQQHDPQNFASSLSALVDEHRLVQACSASGVCEDLRVAQDRLESARRKLPSSPEADRVMELVAQMDGYERQFVYAVREFISQGRDCDLLAASASSLVPPQKMIETLEERIAALRAIIAEIECFLVTVRARGLEE